MESLDFSVSSTSLSSFSLMVNLLIGAVFGFLLRWHYKRFGSTLSNREDLASVLPSILLTVILVISIVKSSLALSLGLVGALSIVRFRTPIKEPEELAYIFVAIGVGLGLGAEQRLPTISAGILILVIIALFKKTNQEKNDRMIFMNINYQSQSKNESLEDDFLIKLNSRILSNVNQVDLRRFDVKGDYIEATYLLDVTGIDQLNRLTEQLQKIYTGINISVLDQNQMPSV